MPDLTRISEKLDGRAADLAALPGESGPLDLARDRIEQIRHFVAAHAAIIAGQTLAAGLEAKTAAEEATSQPAEAQ